MHRWILIALVLILSACAANEPAPQTTVTPLIIPQVPETGGEDDVSTQIAANPPDAIPSPTGLDARGTPTAAMANDLPATVVPTNALPTVCAPTAPDMLGPFYTPGAPTRAVVGEGYVLEGVVRSADGCAPIPGAMVEVWMAGPDGEYSDEYRATLSSDARGYYRLQSPNPPPYAGRPAHIHLRVSASGFQALVTQHYPQRGATTATFDLVLLPE